MNKKGFTLTELMVTIAIISIITLIAVPSIIAIYRNTNRRLYSNKVNTIVTAAELYGSNNLDLFNGRSEVTVYIRDLLAANYLSADAPYGSATCQDAQDINGCIIDPRNKTSMNDKCVVITKEAIGVSVTKCDTLQ